VVGEAAAPSWQHYLEGLWWSGLRLAESLELWWDRRDRLCVDFNGKRPMLWIPAELEKGKRDRFLPMAPEFAEFLERTPEDQRTGQVFEVPGQTVRRLSEKQVCITVSAIGRRAGIKVWTHPATGKVKYASAHDLRRSFGFRWSSRVMPAVLQQLMRHESIETTLRYYVGRNAESTAEVVWQAFESGNTSGNTLPEMADFSGD
jgi:integrase